MLVPGEGTANLDVRHLHFLSDQKELHFQVGRDESLLLLPCQLALYLGGSKA
jgi:hypothetical protein